MSREASLPREASRIGRVLRRLVPPVEVLVLGTATALVLATAIAVSASVSAHLEDSAKDQAGAAIGAVIHGYVDPLLSEDLFGKPDPAVAASVNAQLEALTSSGQLLRVKIFDRRGTVLYSDLAELRGRHFEIEEDLAESLAGETTVDLTRLTQAEDASERMIDKPLLEVYMPVGGEDGAEALGAYEIYQDATELEAAVASARRDVFLIAGGIGLILLATLYAAFRGANRMLRQLTARLRGSEARFRSLVQNSSDLIVLLDRDGLVTWVSPALGPLLGALPERWTGRPIADLVHQEDAAWLRALVDRLGAATTATSDGAVRIAHADGRWRWLELVGTNLLADPDVGAIVLNCRDVTERQALETQLRHQSFHDPLTNLANRPLLADRIEHQLQARPLDGGGVLAVILFDLDDFKSVNDSLGQAAGDSLLRTVAERLSGAVRAQDTAARVGGDEFAVLLSGRERSEIELVAARVREAIGRPVELAGHRLTVSASFGIGFAEGLSTKADELLRDADVAMHLAKAAGKGETVIFENGMEKAAMRRLRMRADLEHALERGELSLRYQPIVELATLEPVGVEALIRWDHPAGVIMPLEFIPLAEETGLIVPIGRWVLEEACRWVGMRTESEGRRRLRLSVNVSSVQLARPDFVAEVADVLRTTGFDGSRLTLELTESVLLDRSGVAIGVMRRLRDLGIRLAIDDFGTGYSSLSYLNDLPIDVLKIDQAFVAGLEHGDDALGVVRSIIHLAGTMGMTTVAEGIEGPGQVGRLRALGAQYGQGFHFARPLTGDELIDYLDGEAAAEAG